MHDANQTKKPRKRKCKVQTEVSRICPRETRKRYEERSRGVGEYIEKGSKNREKEKQKRKWNKTETEKGREEKEKKRKFKELKILNR